VTGDFYVGVRQALTTNVGFSYQNEAPIRPGTFFFTSPVANGGAVAGDPSTLWNDFSATSSNFRLSIEAQIEVGSGVPNCVINTSPTNGATFVSRNVSITWGSGGGNPREYDIYFGTNATPPLVQANFCGNSYTPPTLLLPGTTYYWRVVAKNISGDAIGCTTYSFATAPVPPNDICQAPTPISACGAVLNGFTNNATTSLFNTTTLNNAVGDDGADDVFYSFVANASTHRVTVTPSPLDPTFNPAVQVYTVNCTAPTLVNRIATLNLRPAGFAESFTFNVTPGTPYLIRVYSSGAAGTEGRFTIALTTDGGWTGAASTAYGNPANWCDGAVPVATTNAIIRATPNQPVIALNTTALNLTVDAGATLTIPAGLTYTVLNNAGGGSLNGAGSVLGDGTLSLAAAASAIQNITGSPTVNNLLITNASPSPNGVNLTIGSSVRILNRMTFASSGRIANTGNIIFNSNAAGTASMGSLASAFYSGSGIVTQERYVGGSARWIFMGAPSSGAGVTVSQLSEANAVVSPVNNASLFWFQETDSSWTFDATSNNYV
jgi:hypothetical protein